MTTKGIEHTKFQTERIALFSDAVFAIAITLLIIEVKVPEVHWPATDAGVLEELEKMIPKFIGFLVSFFVIGLYWLVHHRMFGYVTGYSRKLLSNNLVFLLSIVLMPFSSAFYSEYFITYTKIPLAFYVLNICFSGLMIYRLWNVLSEPKNKLTQGLNNRALVRFYKIRALLVPATFVVTFFLTFLINQYAYYITLLIPFVSGWFTAYNRKKHPHIFTD